jgi:hypothetical protein
MNIEYCTRCSFGCRLVLRIHDLKYLEAGFQISGNHQTGQKNGFQMSGNCQKIGKVVSPFKEIIRTVGNAVSPFRETIRTVEK